MNLTTSNTATQTPIVMMPVVKLVVDPRQKHFDNIRCFLLPNGLMQQHGVMPNGLMGNNFNAMSAVVLPQQEEEQRRQREVDEERRLRRRSVLNMVTPNGLMPGAAMQTPLGNLV